MRLVKTDNASIVSNQVILAHSFLKRALGLVIGPALTANQCFLIPGCRSIHTMGMKYCIDAVFIDTRGRIVKIYHKLSPYRFTGFIRAARSVIEFRGGQALNQKLGIGQVLSIQ